VIHLSFIDDINIYNDPIISKKRKGTVDSPFRKITETLTVGNSGKVLLTEIPNKKERVIIKNGTDYLMEVDENTELTPTIFYVDYPEGVVYLHSSLLNQSLIFTYIGEGAKFFPSARIWLENDGTYITTMKDKIDDVDRLINEQKARVDIQIASVPQPYEILDMRVDRNGTVFSVAKDRIDAEQKKIEDAYKSINGSTFNSLKERLDHVDNTLDDLTNYIDTVDGNLSLKVSNMDYTGETIMSKIELTPDTVQISASKVNLVGAVGINALASDVINQINDKVAKSSVNLTGSLPTSITMDSNGITAYTSDITKFARLNDQGLYIKGGAIQIEGGLPDIQISGASKWNIQGTHIDENGIYTGTINANNVKTGKLSGSDGTFWIDLDTSYMRFAYGGKLVSNICQVHAGDGRDITYFSLDYNQNNNAMICLARRNPDGSFVNSLYVTSEYGDVHIDAPTTYVGGNLSVGATLFGNDISFAQGGRFVTDIVGTSWRIANNGTTPKFIPFVSGNGSIGTDAETWGEVWSNWVNYKYLNQFSSRESKENIHVLNEDDAENFVRYIDVFGYHYKDDKEKTDDTLQAGIMYDDASQHKLGKYLVNNEKKSVQPYAFMSIISLAVKKVYKKLDVLFKDVSTLKQEVRKLREETSKLSK
jgi:hypothetical protein